MILRTLAAAALATTMAGAAFAQTSTSTAAGGVLVEVSDSTIVQPFNLPADQLDDYDVYTAEGVEVGDVEDIYGPNAETATHFKVDFDDEGGFPDRDDVLVPIEALTLDGQRLVISLTPAEVSALPVSD